MEIEATTETANIVHGSGIRRHDKKQRSAERLRLRYRAVRESKTNAAIAKTEHRGNSMLSPEIEEIFHSYLLFRCARVRVHRVGKNPG